MLQEEAQNSRIEINKIVNVTYRQKITLAGVQ
jgi:hypothetical protein